MLVLSYSTVDKIVSVLSFDMVAGTILYTKYFPPIFDFPGDPAYLSFQATRSFFESDTVFYIGIWALGFQSH